MKCSKCNLEIVGTVYENLHGEFFCSNCAKYNYVYQCPICNRIMTQFESAAGSYRCEDCYFKTNLYHSHSYHPNIIFDSNRKKHLHIGAELELESNIHENRTLFLQELNNTLSKDKPLFFTKLDGSLSSHNGIEIVSQPMTIKNLIANWSCIIDLAKKYHFESKRNCGLHFHLDRKYLNQRMTRNIDFLINNFQSYFEYIGRRTFNTYCCRSNKQPEYWGENVSNRYHAVNLNNRDTVELRFCKSTNDFETFADTAIFINNFVDYCNTIAKKRLFSISYDEFKKEMNEYNNLHYQVA